MVTAFGCSEHTLQAGLNVTKYINIYLVKYSVTQGDPKEDSHNSKTKKYMTDFIYSEIYLSYIDIRYSNTIITVDYKGRPALFVSSKSSVEEGRVGRAHTL